MQIVKRYGKVFFLSTVVPVIVFVFVFWLLQSIETMKFYKMLGIEGNQTASIFAELRLYVTSYGQVVNKYKEDFQENPSLVCDIDEINATNARLKKHGLTVVVFSDDGEILSDIQTIKSSVMPYLYQYTEKAEAYNDITISLGKDGKYLIHNLIVTNEDHKHVFWLVLDLTVANEYMHTQKMYFLAVSMLASLVVCVIILIWIFRYILEPISVLKDAMAQIMQGNLDVEVPTYIKSDIGDLCKNFDDMRIKLKENAEAVMSSDIESRELISNISHDLKTPLTTIKGYVEGLLDNVWVNNPEKQEKYLRTIYNKATDMDKLIDELTLYSKIGTNRATYVFRKIDARDYFRDCAEALFIELDSKGIDFDFKDMIQDDAIIMADPEYLKRVVNNIISNSVKNMPPENGKISITLADEGKYVKVAMADNGKGIPPKDVPHIFDRFYRGDAARNTSQGGSGIGLSIVKKVIEEHGGKIWVNSVLGEGTTMYFVLKKIT